MIDVIVRAETGDAVNLALTARHVQKRFNFKNYVFTDTQKSVQQGTSLTITNVPLPALFSLDLDQGVRVSTFRSVGISQYLGLEVDTYLLTCSLLGLMQWRVLALNPLLRPEDFLQHESDFCLYSNRSSVQEYIPLLEEPAVCQGCHDFYHCLGADGELRVLDAMLKHIITASRVRER